MIPLTDQAGPAVHLVRHGETDWNVRHLVQGQSDAAELTELGRIQARRCAEVLHASRPARLLSSDLRRARQTADIIGDMLQLPTVVTSLLREQSLGVIEGLTTERAAAAWQQAAVDDDGPLPVVDVRLPGGESLRDVLARVQAFLALPWITETAADVVVISHGDTIRVMLAHLLGDDDHLTWREVGNGDIHSVYRTINGAVASVHTRAADLPPTATHPEALARPQAPPLH